MVELYRLIEWEDRGAIEGTRVEETVIAVFDSKEKAEKAADWMNKNFGYHYGFDCELSFYVDCVFVDDCNIPSILNTIDQKKAGYYGLLGEEWAQA